MLERRIFVRSAYSIPADDGCLRSHLWSTLRTIDVKVNSIQLESQGILHRILLYDNSFI
jgi:hypothetical protein